MPLNMAQAGISPAASRPSWWGQRPSARYNLSSAHVMLPLPTPFAHCSVEKPFLKPVLVSGPNTGERRKLMEMLVEEFPDVFDLPRQHTTRPPDEHSRHVGTDGDELQLAVQQSDPGDDAASSGSSSDSSSSGNNGAASTAPQQPAAGSSGSGSGCSAGSSGDGCSAAVLGPQPVVLGKQEFEAAAASGSLLEAHCELFKHPLATHKYGHSMDDLQAVIRAGKLPLLELEAEEVELVKVTKGVDCLSVFLAPPSLEVHQQRLREAATETDEEVQQRGTAVAAELGLVRSNKVFDQVLVNDDADEAYKQLKAAISRFRPDLIPPGADADDAAAAAAGQAAQQAAGTKSVIVILTGPSGVR